MFRSSREAELAKRVSELEYALADSQADQEDLRKLLNEAYAKIVANDTILHHTVRAIVSIFNFIAIRVHIVGVIEGEGTF